MNPRSVSVCILAAAALVALSACSGDDDKPSPGADGGMDGSTGNGMNCVAGGIGCPCSASNVCAVGECVGGSCADCERGAEDCVCRSNGSCDGDLRCEGEVCKACQAGTEDCPCGSGDSCDSDLVCMEGVCAQASCTAGVEECPCRADDPRCDGEAVCDANDVCRICTTDMPDCPCDADGACSGGLICDSDSCRDAVTCDDLVSSGDCDANQSCTEASGQDATCVADTCIDGYRWVAGLGCVECASADCSAEPTCGGANSIAGQCAAEYKECDDSSGAAVCGACLANTVPAGDRCVPEILCGSDACASDQYCDTDTDTCRDVPCPAGEAQDATLGTCSACNITCDTSGLTGRIWPFRTADDSCICETAPGYYMPPGGTSDPELCDADLDGWVVELADGTAIRSSDALRHNARCNIRLVDTVLLFDEYGTSLEVGSCTEGLVKNPDAANCAGRLNLRLLESQRNDVPGKPTAADQAPEYGARLLEAEELTGLTKFCVDLLGDFNDDGNEDITEVQESAADLGATTDDQRRLRSFSFFGELYRSYYQAGGSGGVGTLVIAERSRCDASGFALAYDSAEDEYDPAKPETYWRSCYRNRDPDYDDVGGDPGFDFAQWSCDASSGTCPTAGPAHPTLTGSLDPDVELLRDHGLCELGGSPPADGVWRGMNHHSQFRCVQVTQTVADATYQLAPGSFSNGDYALNLCGAEGTREVSAGTKEQEPVLDCMVDDPADGTPTVVGLAALTYKPYGSGTAGQGTCTDTCIAGAQYCDTNADECKWILTSATPALPTQPDYQGGCVNETVEWGGIACPYEDYNRLNEVDAFGRYSCYGDAPNCLWGAAGARSVLTLTDAASSSDASFCDNLDGKMNPCSCWR